MFQAVDEVCSKLCSTMFLLLVPPWLSFVCCQEFPKSFVPSSVQTLYGKQTVLLMLQDGENSTCDINISNGSPCHQISDRTSPTRRTSRDCNNTSDGTSYVSTFSFSAVLASCMATASLTPMIQVGLHLLGDSVDFESVANCMTLVRICHHSKRGSSDLRQDSLK